MQIFNKKNSKIGKLYQRIWDLEKERNQQINRMSLIIAELQIKIENTQKTSVEALELARKARPLDIEDRLQAIELWKAKLHAMITETTPRGKEKLNRIGKKFMRG